MAIISFKTEREAVEFIKEHLCGECGGKLRYTFSEGIFHISCSSDWTHKGYRKEITLPTEANLVPVPEIKEGMVLTSEILKALKSLIPEVGDRDGKYKPSPTEILRAYLYAKEVGADLVLEEVVLYFGRPKLTIDYWYRKFREKYPKGYLKTRPLNEEERKLYKASEDKHVWKCEVYDEQGRLLAEGYGEASEERPHKSSAVEKEHPQRIAEKRAEEDAIRKAIALSRNANGV